MEKDGHYYLETNLFDYIKDFRVRMINTEILGKAFEPEQPFENPDGTESASTRTISAITAVYM